MTLAQLTSAAGTVECVSQVIRPQSGLDVRSGRKSKLYDLAPVAKGLFRKGFVFKEEN